MAAQTTASVVAPAEPMEIAQPSISDYADNEEMDTGSDAMAARLAAVVENMDTRSDADSSSLTDLAEGTDDHESPSDLARRSSLVEEDDSEAETERLEDTPRKTLGAATGSIVFSNNINNSPSKLAHVVAAEAESPPESPITPIEEKEVPTLEDKRYSDSEMMAAQQLLATISEPTTSLMDSLARKRKRPSPKQGATDELEAEAPVRKRSGSSRLATAKTAIIRDQNDHSKETLVEDAIEQDDDDEIEGREDAADETTESSSAKAPLKTRKTGKRKGKKVVESTEVEMETYEDADQPDMDEGDQAGGEEEDSAATEEKIAEQKESMDALTRIRAQFNEFRDKEMTEQLENLNSQIAALEAPDTPHPEFLNMLKCLDERRDEKLALETTYHKYRVAGLKKTTIAQRQQIQTQYFQAVREHRDKAVENCQKRLNQLQRERRRHGAEEVEYATLYKPKRAEQIRYQTAYNKEVSILAGVAKYRGFPAAPDILAARPTEVEEDLKAMEITPRVAAPPAAPAAPYAQALRAEHAAAEESFLEKNAWANPLHPSHQGHYSQALAQSRNASNPLITPAAQKRTVDLTATNGSASTIEAISNPPSSNAAQGTGNSHRARYNKGDDSSPLMPFKRSAANAELSQPSPPVSAPDGTGASPAAHQWRQRQKATEQPFSSPMQSKMASAAASALSAGGPSRNRTPLGSRNMAVNGNGGSTFGR